MKKYFLTLLICLASFFLNFAILAQEQNSSSTSTEDMQVPATAHSPQSPEPFLNDPFADSRLNEPEDFQTKFMNMLFLLGLIIAFMLLASWMLKRLTRNRIEQMNSASSIKLLETRYLSPRSTIYLIDVMGQGLVIAESQTGVSHLATVSLEEDADTDFSSKNTGKTFQV